jgi:hypothetical protein
MIPGITSDREYDYTKTRIEHTILPSWRVSCTIQSLRKVVHSATIVRYGCKDETRYGPARPRVKASLSPDLSF